MKIRLGKGKDDNWQEKFNIFEIIRPGASMITAF